MVQRTLFDFAQLWKASTESSDWIYVRPGQWLLPITQAGHGTSRCLAEVSGLPAAPAARRGTPYCLLHAQHRRLWLSSSCCFSNTSWSKAGVPLFHILLIVNCCITALKQVVPCCARVCLCSLCRAVCPGNFLWAGWGCCVGSAE